MDNGKQMIVDNEQWRIDNIKPTLSIINFPLTIFLLTISHCQLSIITLFSEQFCNFKTYHRFLNTGFHKRVFG
jgi:hypothetical protein